MIVIHKTTKTKFTKVKAVPTGQPFKLGFGATTIHVKVNKDNKAGYNAVCLQNGCLEHLGDDEPAFPVNAKVVVGD